MFDWDPRKAKSNRLKHGVSFEEAATAFLDQDGLDGEDLEHSESEARRLRLAKSSPRESLGYSVYDKEKRQ
jgi:uncharacterized DUF497 family protein